MSQIVIPGSQNRVPFTTLTGGGAYTAITLNATGEVCVFAGSVILENPLGGSKTISAAGSGKIVWQSGTTTFADAGTTFEVGIQDISTVASPTQGDGTFDVVASFTGGGGGVTSAATQTSVMTSGTKTIANGDMIAIVFSATAIGGVDSIIVNAIKVANTGFLSNAGFPAVMSNTAGSYVKQSSTAPNACVIFDDGSIGWLYGAGFASTQPVQLTFNSGSATADEYGNFLQYPFTFLAEGIQFTGQLSGTSADAELLLYTDPLGTPSAIRTITLDATQWPSVSNTVNSIFIFPTPYLLKANTPYAISLRPTTTNNVSLFYRDVDIASNGKSQDMGTYNYAVNRLNNTGAFADYNGGTAKTRQMAISLLSSSVEQGVSYASYRLGI